MMRLRTMLAAMLVLTAGTTAPAKTEMRTFPVLAGAGAHDVYPAPRGSNPFPYPTAMGACGSLLVAKARFGGPNPRPTSSS